MAHTYELLEWLNLECPKGTMTYDLSHDFAENLRNRLDNEQPKEVEQNEWISVETDLPPRHKNVWCYNRDGWQFEGRVCYGMHKPFFTYPKGDGNASNTAPNWIDVTHWQPLPLPPIKQKQ